MLKDSMQPITDKLRKEKLVELALYASFLEEAPC